MTVGLSAGEKAGIAIAVIVGVAILAIIVFICIRKRKSKSGIARLLARGPSRSGRLGQEQKEDDEEQVAARALRYPEEDEIPSARTQD